MGPWAPARRSTLWLLPGTPLAKRRPMQPRDCARWLPLWLPPRHHFRQAFLSRPRRGSSGRRCRRCRYRMRRRLAWARQWARGCWYGRSARHLLSTQPPPLAHESRMIGTLAGQTRPTLSRRSSAVTACSPPSGIQLPWAGLPNPGSAYQHWLPLRLPRPHGSDS